MSLLLNPYISFQGNARQALEFYQSVLGGSLSLNTFGELGVGGPEQSDQIMHGQLQSETGLTLMAADTPPGMDHSPGNNIALSLSGEDVEQLRGYWAELCDGGTVAMPLERQIWGDEFGMCVDRFGITWMVNINLPQGGADPTEG